MENSSSPSTASGICWNLGDLYPTPDAPAIQTDQQRALEDTLAFDAAYRGRIAELTPEDLAVAVERMEVIVGLVSRPLIHAHLLFSGDTSVWGPQLNAARHAHSEVMQGLIFFELEWLALDDTQVATHLAHPALGRWRHYLEQLGLTRPHVLSEPEEKILSIKSNTGEHAFQRLFDETTAGLLCRMRDESGDRGLSLQQALALLYRPERETRQAAAASITATLAENQRLLAYIFNTLLQEHTDNDRLRNRPHPMVARNLSNEIDQESVEALLTTCDRNASLVGRYYTLKRKLLGLDRLYDYDRYAPVGKNLPACSFEQAREIVLDAYGAFSPRMAEVAGRFFSENWIDAELRSGKTGGAFSAATLPEVHPYILLNYTDTLRDVMTLAHELGHGVHQFLSGPRGLFQFQTPLTMAETASVFGEMLTFEKLLGEQSADQVRLELLCGKLEDIFATVFRQASMTRFEQSLHAAHRERGELGVEDIGDLWMTANRAMFGDTVELSEGYRHWWSYIPHFIHSPFYCYAYSFGELLVLALYQRYREEGDSFVPRYLALLEAGGSDSPENLLKPLGMDIRSPSFWEQGMALLEGMVSEAERLAGSLE